MSTDWDVYCMDCGDGLGLSDWNHLEEAVQDLCNAASALAQIAELAKGQPVDIFCRAGYRNDDILVDWFLTHKGHKLVPRSEYGDFLDQCGESFVCSGCGENQRCRQPKNHDGPHSQTRTKRVDNV